MTKHINPAELFLSDPHGEYEEFSHILRTAGATIREALDAVFGQRLTAAQKDEVATLIAYPEQKISLLSMPRTLLRDVLGELAAAYGTTAAVTDSTYKPAADSDAALIAAAHAVRDAAVSRIHVLGDIFDRGPAPDLILDELCDLAERGELDPAHVPALDIEWGNHDILWMGAALGQPACVATAVRICARYGNLSILEENYGIDITPLRTFAATVYADDPCTLFLVKHNPALSDDERLMHAKIQKAIALIQFKVESRLIAENPGFGLASRDLINRLNFARGTVNVDGQVLPMLDMHFPTINPERANELTPDEQRVLDALIAAFMGCTRLQRHARLFLTCGSLYKCLRNVSNGSGASDAPNTSDSSGASDISDAEESDKPDTLLLHACVPLNEDGSLKEVTLFGQTYAGRALFDAVDAYVRDAYLQTDAAARKRGADLIWYLWLGAGSPLFAKNKMATFELYFVEDKAARKEEKNAFYRLRDDEQVIGNVLENFGCTPQTGRILCGHVPVKVKDGESPIRCNGKVIDLDGGMSKPYQKDSGVAGFTLIVQDGVWRIATHEAFCGTQEALTHNLALRSTYQTIR